MDPLGLQDEPDDEQAKVERLKRFFLDRWANPDTRSHAEYLADMRAKQAAGQLKNPATAALLGRLERVIR